jgi:hypothetical protein
MTETLSRDWSDERIVAYIREWAIERSKCGLDSEKYNRINDEHLSPAMKLLRERGPGSIAKVLPLLDDDNPDVRLAAAAFAYKIDPPRCLEVLRDLMKTPSLIGFAAYGSLWLEDPAACPDLVALWGPHFPELQPKR